MQYRVEVVIDEEGNLTVSGNLDTKAEAMKVMYLAIVNMLEAEGIDLEDFVVEQESCPDAVVLH